MEPLIFQALYQTRVWGGRELENSYGRQLPNAEPYGESWEISDRENEQSVVTEGDFQGRSLNELWTTQRAEIFGAVFKNHASERFPLLIKILDAREDLSIQVHPPANLAKDLGGVPKTEMWFIADRDPGAKLYVGLKNGVTREKFAKAIENGSVAEKVHVIEPEIGDSIFIPSGRLHAIGAGFLIFEIQQNSDTTYRVFDWNRAGLDGKARELHVEKSLASIDFDDFEPAMDEPQNGTLANCEYFRVDRLKANENEKISQPDRERFAIVGVVSGRLSSAGGRIFTKGDFFLLPLGAEPLTSLDQSEILLIWIAGDRT